MPDAELFFDIAILIIKFFAYICADPTACPIIMVAYILVCLRVASSFVFNFCKSVS